MTASIAFIGAGNMATSLIRGLLASGRQAGSLCASDPSPAQRDALADTGVALYDDNNTAVANADVVVLAVKPQLAKQVLVDLSALTQTQLLVSIAAGIPIAALQKWTSPRQPVVRVMPNTPALLGAGMSGLYAPDNVSPDQRDTAEAITAAVGDAVWVNTEAGIDAVTAVSGSGPAYFFYLMEQMIRAGEQLGLDSQTATTLTLQTARGAAMMALEGSDSPARLRHNVTSPGGTTEAALNSLDRDDVASALVRALGAAAARAAEMAEELTDP